MRVYIIIIYNYIYIYIYIASNSMKKPIKDPIINTLDKKKIEEDLPKNDGNEQLSAIL